MTQLEIACFHPDSVGIAWEAGAQRAEICRDRSTEGLSPDYEVVKNVLRRFDIPLNVMVRPRAGTYVYSELEFQQLLLEISQFRSLPINGLVMGSLMENGNIHLEQNKRLVAAAGNLPCTFHRAFDVVPDFESALESLIDCGYSTVLTSAGKLHATEGKKLLRTLIQQAGNRIVVMPGGGVRANHVRELVEFTQAKWIHTSAINNETTIADPIEIINLIKAMK